MYKICSFILYFFCFCPFLFPISSFATDVQFYAFLMSLLLIIFNLNRLCFNRGLGLLLVYSFISILVGLLSNTELLTTLKCIYSYVSLFVVIFAMYNVFIWDKGVNLKFCKIFIILWLIVGVIQFLLSPDFLKFYISGARTTINRGVYGLASEPSFFGVQCFYFLYLTLLMKRKSKYVYMCAIFLMAFVLAQSMMGMMFVGGFFLFFLIDYVFSYKHSILGIVGILGVCCIFLMLLFSDFMAERRIAVLYDMFSQGGVRLILEDESASVRFRTIVESISIFYENVFLPTGYTVRVGSMFGGILQELGFLGIPLLMYIVHCFTIFFKTICAKIVSCVILSVLFFSIIQLSNPMLSFVISISMYNNTDSIKFRWNK